MNQTIDRSYLAEKLPILGDALSTREREILELYLKLGSISAVSQAKDFEVGYQRLLQIANKAYRKIKYHFKRYLITEAIKSGSRQYQQIRSNVFSHNENPFKDEQELLGVIKNMIESGDMLLENTPKRLIHSCPVNQ